MCKAFEDLAEKRADERVLEVQKAIAKRVLARGKLSVEEVAECTRLPVNVVVEIANLLP